jgi:hypothetical protein
MFVNRAPVIEALGQYVSVLDASQRSAEREHKGLYQVHLADASRILAAIAEEDEMRVAEAIFDGNRNFGWGFLPGEEGERACAAWVTFARFATSRLKNTAARHFATYGKEPHDE